MKEELEAGEMVLCPKKQQEMFKAGRVIESPTYSDSTVIRIGGLGESYMSRKLLYELGKYVGKRTPKKSMNFKSFKKKVLK